jgi:3-oxoacyl-(acyl-carrier-protein) synthase
MGAVCGLGWGVPALWAGLRAGRSAIGPFVRFDHAAHRTHVAAEVPLPEPGGGPIDPALSLADRFALYAAREAAAQAGFSAVGGDLGADRCGVFFGSSTGGMLESEEFFARLLQDRRRARGRILAAQPVSAPGDAVARCFGVQGPVVTFSSACSSGALALTAALEALRHGEVEVALSGGADSLCQLTYAGFNALRSVDEEACRPFRASRAGMSFGEGAAVLVLEPLERALARGAPVLAEFRGAASTSDAYHMTAPEPHGCGAAAAMKAALDDAGIGPEAIDFIDVHGTGTPLNDAAEWHALHTVFGARLDSIPLAATKALIGHLLGSAGALEAVVTVLCLEHGEVHPAPRIGGEALDPALPSALVLDRPRPVPAARVALSTSLAFGGSNAALVFSRRADGDG